MACVDFYVDDYLDEASDRALKNELTRRRARSDWQESPDPNGPEPWTRRGMADDIRQAFYARNASRLELLLTQLEVHEDA